MTQGIENGSNIDQDYPIYELDMTADDNEDLAAYDRIIG